MEKVLEWQAQGYPKKNKHKNDFPFLCQNPQTDLEKAMAKIEQVLAKERAVLARKIISIQPRYFGSTRKASIDNIKTRWELPAVYLTFLERFRLPMMLSQGINLYGANTLIANQYGYAFSSPNDELFPRLESPLARNRR